MTEPWTCQHVTRCADAACSYNPAVRPSESHDGTAHTDHTGHFWLTCSCGWQIDPAPNNWDRWVELLEAHRAEAAS